MRQADYIVVGAGSTGCVAARRLAERGFSVCLIEAGSLTAEDAPGVRRPALYPRLFHGPLDGGLATIPQSALAGRRLHQPRGRGFGGSTLMNAMIWLPPLRADLARLHDQGGEAWQPEAVQAAMAEVTAWVRPEAPRWISPLVQACISALQAAKLRVQPYQRMNQDGVRRTAGDLLHQSAAAFRVQPVVGIVDRLEIDGGQVTGVRLCGDERLGPVVRARRAVILTAGTLHTPAILIRSGIGPRQVLDALEVSEIRDCPAVGQNLQDHLVIPLIYAAPDHQPFNLPNQVPQIARWQHLHSGPVCCNLAEAGGFLDVDEPGTAIGYPLQWFLTPTHYLRYPHPTAEGSLTVGIVLSHPTSRGQLTVAPHSNGTATQTLLDPRYLSTADDLSRSLAAVSHGRKLAAILASSRIIGREQSPGLARGSTTALQRYVQRYAQTLYHPVGTCAWGNSTDSVLTPQLTLRELAGCHVWDASILPFVPAANPNALLMAIAYLFASRI